MCGIAGFVGQGDRHDLERMTRAIAHRGPDGEGFQCFSDLGVHLGHRRLSIIDLDGGHQPMANEDATVWVSFNGEIYNHMELRQDLMARGHVFATDHCDTEVLVHGWEEWGEDLPLKLNGMFGFAIWDANRKCVFLARDRFGEKPLFWARQGDLFLFASELSAIAAHTGFRATTDVLSLKKYFAHGFIPAPNAIYRDANKLPPGHGLRFDVQSGDVRTQAYWQFRIEPDEAPPSLDEAAEEVRALLLQSVRRRLMSDVPLGVFLSGGVDSSTAAAAMCEWMAPGDVNSFSIGFEEASFDESVFAKRMADALSCSHHQDILNLDTTRSMMDDVLGRFDEPLADGSILPTYLLCRFAKRHVTVALSGDGGDELFAGYDPFKALKPARLYAAVVPALAHRGARALAELLPKSKANMSFDFKVRRALQGLSYPPGVWNPAWLAPLDLGDFDDIFGEPVHVEDVYGEALALWEASPQLGDVDRTLEFYSNFYLPDDILTKVDRAAMWNSLETRSIFLDNDLVEYVRKLPAQYKFDGKTRKKVLKRAVRGLVPDEIANRPKKGFGIPLMGWLREMDLDETGANAVSMRAGAVRRRIDQHRAGSHDHRLFLWAWATLQRFASQGGLPDAPGGR